MSDEAYEGGIAINIGTTFSRVAVWDKNDAVTIPDKYGSRAIPSCVAFTENGDILIGQDAVNQADDNPKNTVFAVKGLVGCEFDNLSVQTVRGQYPFNIVEGENKRPWIRVRCGGKSKELAPEEITALLLLELKKMSETYLGKTVTKAVITVPAIFNVQERRAMLDAATISGIKVLQLLNDTTAAAMAYQINNRTVDGKNRNVIFVEFGGSRLSVSLLAIHGSNIKVKATDGWYCVGGDDFTHSLVKYCVEKFKHDTDGTDISENPHVMHCLYVACEKAKCDLSSDDEAAIALERAPDDVHLHIPITRGEFEKITKAHFGKFAEAVKEMQEFIDEHEIKVDDVVLMGGSTCIPKVRQVVSEAFGGKGKLNTNTNPEEAVVLAAAARAFALCGGKNKKTDGLTARDMTLRVFGIQNTQAGSGRKRIFDKNTPLPAERSFSYSNLYSKGFSKNVYVIEGGHSFFWWYAHSATLDLSNIPVKLDGTSNIDIIFAMDASGIPSVSVRRRGSDKRLALPIKNAFNLEEAQVASMAEAAARWWHQKHSECSENGASKIAV